MVTVPHQHGADFTTEASWAEYLQNLSVNVDDFFSRGFHDDEDVVWRVKRKYSPELLYLTCVTEADAAYEGGVINMS